MTEISASDLKKMIKDAAKEATDESTKDLAKTVSQAVTDTQAPKPEEPAVVHSWEDVAEAQRQGKAYVLPVKTHTPTDPVDMTPPRKIIEKKPEGTGNFNEGK
jgi:hypothetical protein